VDFNFTPTFPLRTVTPLRVALQEPRCTHAVYKAAWVDGHNIGEPDVLKRVLDEAGFDGQALLEGTQDPDIKAQLFSNTEEAIARNVCGVPSLIVNQDIVFWGQDRLSMVEGALAGWVPKV
jgi:2-hydroxychromene-2-carboxylate isomerase